jgi:hypothetical protein
MASITYDKASRICRLAVGPHTDRCSTSWAVPSPEYSSRSWCGLCVDEEKCS